MAGCSYATVGDDIKNCTKFWSEDLKEWGQLGRPGHKWDDNVKIYL
jgi:hypothetical protein